MDLLPTVRFYQGATDAELEEYEEALDRDDVHHARAILSEFGSRQAVREQGFLDHPPQEGDLVWIKDTNRYGKILALSEDGKQAVISGWISNYVVPYDRLARIR